MGLESMSMSISEEHDAGKEDSDSMLLIGSWVGGQESRRGRWGVVGILPLSFCVIVVCSVAVSDANDSRPPGTYIQLVRPITNSSSYTRA